MQVDLYNASGVTVGKYTLNPDLFGIEPNESAVHTAVVTYLANQRQGTKAQKTRAEVRGGGAKPRPQKGTGRSRQGSIRNPQWKGGGVVFAAKPRDFSLKINKKVKRLALKSVLSAKAAEGKVLVLDELKIPEIKTKLFKEMLDNLKLTDALVVLPDNDKNAVLSARNLQEAQTASVGTINVYDILNRDTFVLTVEAAEKMTEVYA
jgi:large subunit ribosomal protein L4